LRHGGMERARPASARGYGWLSHVDEAAVVLRGYGVGAGAALHGEAEGVWFPAVAHDGVGEFDDPVGWYGGAEAGSLQGDAVAVSVPGNDWHGVSLFRTNLKETCDDDETAQIGVFRG